MVSARSCSGHIDGFLKRVMEKIAQGSEPAILLRPVGSTQSSKVNAGETGARKGAVDEEAIELLKRRNRCRLFVLGTSNA